MKLWRINASVLLISVVGLAYEVTLTRVFSVSQWHNFAYMIISMAMLGFAGAGTALAMISPNQEGKKSLFQAFAGVTVPLIPVCFAVSQIVPFETYQLTTQPIQIAYVFLLYLVLSVPFFTISGVIALSFLMVEGRIGTVYCSNLIGSGLGALVSAVSLYVVPPFYLIYLLMLPAGLSFLCAFVDSTGSLFGYLGMASVLVLILFVTGIRETRISQYKPLYRVLKMPSSTVLGKRYSPLSTVTAVVSPRIRQSPGQISGMPDSGGQPMPEQVGLYLDGGGPTVVNKADSPVRMEQFSYLNYVTSALPFKLRSPSKSLVLGAGGGTDIWKALFHGVKEVTAVEVDPSIHGFMRNELREYSGFLYEKDSVRPILDDPRGYLESDQNRYDLIEIPLTNSISTSGGGVHSLQENYLFTVEGFERALRKLKKKGLFLTTQWVNSPPRSTLKTVSTLLQAARNAGYERVQNHLLIVRSWNTVSIVFSESRFTKAEILKTRTFLNNRSFDWVYYPGMAPDEAEKYIETGDHALHGMVRQLLKNPYRFYDDYLFNVRPARDNRPYFNHYFKWDSVNRIVEQLGNQSLRFVDWGYVVLVVTLLQALPLAFLLVGLPFLSKSFSDLPFGSIVVSGCYFLLLGLGFMLLEISFIQVFMQYLHYPVYSVAVVLTGFLVFSGIGSLITEVFSNRENYLVFLVAYLVLVTVSMAYLLGLNTLFRWTTYWSQPTKVLVALGLLLPLAVPLGVPFPVGLRSVAEESEDLISFAWATNGASSVVGAILGLILAIQFGFRSVIVGSLVLYMASGFLLVWYDR